MTCIFDCCSLLGHELLERCSFLGSIHLYRTSSAKRLSFKCFGTSGIFCWSLKNISTKARRQNLTYSKRRWVTHCQLLLISALEKEKETLGDKGVPEYVLPPRHKAKVLWKQRNNLPLVKCSLNLDNCFETHCQKSHLTMITSHSTSAEFINHFHLSLFIH